MRRILGVILMAICVALGVAAGVNLRTAVSMEEDLKGADQAYQAATADAPQNAAAAHQGENSLAVALAGVRSRARQDEIAIVASLVGLFAGLAMVRPRRPETR